MRTQQRKIDDTDCKRFYCLLFLAAAFFLFFTPRILHAQKKKIVVPEGVELFESEGAEHLESGKRAFYKTDPPTSGPHSPQWLPPSVYKLEDTKPELLVHNLEHGNIVIYFDRASIKESDLKWLIQQANEYLGQWDGVLLVERSDKNHPLILTAWRAMLRLKKFEKPRVLSFIDTFRGRGPEHSVR